MGTERSCFAAGSERAGRFVLSERERQARKIVFLKWRKADVEVVYPISYLTGSQCGSKAREVVHLRLDFSLFLFSLRDKFFRVVKISLKA